jgi:hypothetical protein
MVNWTPGALWLLAFVPLVWLAPVVARTSASSPLERPWWLTCAVLAFVLAFCRMVDVAAPADGVTTW